LRELVQEAVAGLAGVGRRKMLVSVGWAVKDRVFALVSRQGRIIVRLHDERAERELLDMDGAEPWKFGTRAPPRGWVQLPEGMHEDASALREWLGRAWSLGREAPPAAKRPTKTRQLKGGAAPAPATTRARSKATNGHTTATTRSTRRPAKTVATPHATKRRASSAT
jgi:TfoX/Sxy family transcriptional regulator of competence genes